MKIVEGDRLRVLDAAAEVGSHQTVWVHFAECIKGRLVLAVLLGKGFVDFLEVFLVNFLEFLLFLSRSHVLGRLILEWPQLGLELTLGR